jgi:hypothetical protein
MAENYFVNVLIPLKGVLCPVGILKRVQLVWARISKVITNMIPFY